MVYRKIRKDFMHKSNISDRQLAANRANAQKSTGPRTPDGKDSCRLNAITHGITARTPVLSTESENEWNAFRQGHLDRLLPQDRFESGIVDELARIAWHMRRIRDIEDVQLEIELRKPGLLTGFDFAGASAATAVAHSRLATGPGGGPAALANRQLSRLSREYHRTVRMLLDLRASLPPAAQPICAGQNGPIPISGHHPPQVDEQLAASASIESTLFAPNAPVQLTTDNRQLTTACRETPHFPGPSPTPCSKLKLDSYLAVRNQENRGR